MEDIKLPQKMVEKNPRIIYFLGHAKLNLAGFFSSRRHDVAMEMVCTQTLRVQESMRWVQYAGISLLLQESLKGGRGH